MTKIDIITNGYLAIVRIDVHRIFRIWIQTLVPPIISQGLYFIIFGGIIGSQIGSVSGLSYMQFILPGLVMMAVITNSFTNTASVVVSAKFLRSIEEIMVSPVPKYVVLLGYCTGGMIRGLINGFMVLAIALFFIPFSMHSIPLMLLFSVLTSLFFALGGFINALFASTFDQISIIPTFVLTPLTYLGGVFYEINRLPVFWQNVSKFNPIIYMVDGFRYSFYGISSQNIFVSIFMLIFMTIVLFVINWAMLIKGYGIRN